jgi:hypothetical protein
MRNFIAVILALALCACGGAEMRPVYQAPVIRQGESMLVFMRPSLFLGVHAASVFDVSGPDSTFIGTVNHGTKVAYPLKPGDYTFMVVGESADFMQARILPGRTYYALVTPRVGAIIARFSFRPIRQGELTGPEFTGWDSAAQLVESGDEGRAWAAENAPDIASKRARYWPDWQRKPEHQRASQTLNAEDGELTASAASSAPAATAAPRAPAANPAVGDTWTYRVSQGGRPRPDQQVKLAYLSPETMLEEISGAGPALRVQYRKGAHLVPVGDLTMFSPYLSALAPPPAGRMRVNNLDLRTCGPGWTCSVSANVFGSERVQVAAGTFDAIRVDISQSWTAPSQTNDRGESVTRRMTVWYAPEVKRAIRVVSRGTQSRSVDTQFELELLRYQLQ